MEPCLNQHYFQIVMDLYLAGQWRRNHVASALVRRYFDVIGLMGIVSFSKFYQTRAISFDRCATKNVPCNVFEISREEWDGKTTLYNCISVKSGQREDDNETFTFEKSSIYSGKWNPDCFINRPALYPLSYRGSERLVVTRRMWVGVWSQVNFF